MKVLTHVTHELLSSIFLEYDLFPFIFYISFTYYFAYFVVNYLNYFLGLLQQIVTEGGQIRPVRY